MNNKFFKIFVLSFVLTSILWIPYIFSYFSNVDEPGYFASALHLAKGKLLYKDVFEAKGPGIMYIFTFFVKFFHKNPTFFLHVFMFLILILDSFLIFKILDKKVSSNFATIGFFFPVFLSCFYPIDMITGPEIFVSFILLLAFFIFLYFSNNKISIFFTGLFSGLILLFKPFGIFYIICFLIFCTLKTKRLQNFFIFLLGTFIPCFSFLLYIYSKNLTHDFHLWTIEYPIFVSKTIPIGKKIYFFFPMIGRILFLNPFYIIFGFPLIFKKEYFKENFDIIILFLVSLLWGASHGLAFPHHYMVSIPFIFMISVIGFYKFNENILKNNFEVKKILNLFITLSIFQSLIYWNGFDFYKKWIEFIKEKKKVEKPVKILFVGPNGHGKTTTIAKIAHLLKSKGISCTISASDTFRAAAIEQLEIWGERVGIPVIKHREGADPGAVAFDGLKSAKARNIDIVMVDTAGRLHTKYNLMEELKKVRRVIEREREDYQLYTLLVIDATMGQNAINQAKMFNEALMVDGIAVTKLDGTAKGGVVISIVSELKIPVVLVGVGEDIDDMQSFNSEEFVNALFWEMN